jgi:hypothetical protein
MGGKGSWSLAIFVHLSPVPTQHTDKLHGSRFPLHGDKEYAYCQNPSCKARLIIQGDKAEGHALSHV